MQSEQKFYEMEVAGVKRQLPICRVNEHLSIAAFVMFSDVELTIAASNELLKIVPEFDVLVTAEAKGIPLAYEMSRTSGKKYILARKVSKLYMTNPIEIEVKSITHETSQTLFMDEHERDYLNGKKVLIVDDVVSTGESLHALEELVTRAGGNIVGKAFVLAEGDAADSDGIIYLEKLPLFFD